MEHPDIAKPWTVTSEKVEAAVRRIIDVSRPLQLILFGSYVMGRTGINSDLDIVVIVSDDVENPRKESVRIRRALHNISMPMDILVVPASKWEQLRELPGMIYREAWKKGRVVYES